MLYRDSLDVGLSIVERKALPLAL